MSEEKPGSRHLASSEDVTSVALRQGPEDVQVVGDGYNGTQ